ncbi:MAG: hypothetical protein IMW89_11640 [Ktedonobacteraceae bacterium]|nr:hypothetical protein [Ktedonobacteraceae bacterium]
MSFCGQCGFHLTSGMSNCPRCGTPVEVHPELSGEANADDPTIASRFYLPPHPSQSSLQKSAGPHTPASQQRLVLRPTPGAPTGQETQAAQPGYNLHTPLPPSIGQPGQPGTMSQNVGGGYPPQGASYTGFGPLPTTGYGTPGAMPGPSAEYYLQEQEARAAEARSARGRTTGLVLILLGLLCILGAVTLFLIQRPSGSGSTGDGSSSPPAQQVQTTTPQQQQTPSATMTALEQAQAVIQHYYDAINRHDYQAAYALWLHYPQSQADFAKGFKNTLHDTLVIDGVEQQADGTVKVTVTVTATERASPGKQQQQSVYTGYYLVQQQNDGTWKIINAHLAKA